MSHACVAQSSLAKAISLRPKLARQLFVCFDQPPLGPFCPFCCKRRHGVYIVSLFKNGIWMNVEIDLGSVP